MMRWVAMRMERWLEDRKSDVLYVIILVIRRTIVLRISPFFDMRCLQQNRARVIINLSCTNQAPGLPPYVQCIVLLLIDFIYNVCWLGFK